MDLGLNRDTIIIFAFIIAALVLTVYDNRKKKSKLNDLACGKEISPEEFLKINKKEIWRSEKRPVSSRYDAPGVYVLFNYTKNKYLVGQTSKTISMVNQHLSGHGNVTLCGDWACGDKFTIRIVNLQGSGFVRLEELAAHVSSQYEDKGESYE